VKCTAGVDAALAYGSPTPGARISDRSNALEDTLEIQANLLFVLSMKHLKHQIITPFPSAPTGSFGNGTQRQIEFQGRRKNLASGRSSVFMNHLNTAQRTLNRKVGIRAAGARDRISA
jgi:hypothetical protein